MAKISELKSMIVDLEVRLREARIPKGHCPYVYDDIGDGDEIDCSTEDCDICRSKYMTKYREQVRKEVRKW